jgi:hypothetical protein
VEYDAGDSKEGLEPVWNDDGCDADDLTPNQNVCGLEEGLFTVPENDPC